MKKLIYLGLFSCIAIVTKAQQLPQYSQYILNKYVINPASAGTENYFQGQSNYRSQWRGIKDAPRTYILSVNGPIQDEKMAVGGYMFSDVVGPTRRTGINLSYAYKVKLTESIKLSMAINAGVLQYAVDGSEIVFEEQDDFASSSLERNVVPDAGFSFYIHNEKAFLGASAPQLIRNQIKFEQSIENQVGRLSNHYFLMGGYKYDVTESVILEPSFLLKYVNPTPVQYEIALRGIYNEKYWIGASYRKDDAIGMLFGLVFQENLSVGYSYDLIQSDIGQYSSGSHEIMLSIKFNDPNSAE